MSENASVIKKLFPIKLGENFEADVELEGQYLDSAQASADRLLANCFGDTTIELLNDWERVYGIVPPSGASTASRVTSLVAKVRAKGGLSTPYFVALADTLGYDIEIVEPQPFMAGINGAGDTVYVPEIRFCWRVDVQDAEPPINYFRAGQSCAGDSLGALTPTAELEQLLTDLKPAHTFVYFTYP